MKAKKKELSGSLKIEPSVLAVLKKHCKDNGILVTYYATAAVKEKLEKEKK